MIEPTAGTAMPRHIAAILDNLVSMILSVVLAMQLPNNWPVLQTITLIVAYLGYYFVSEVAFSSSLGKWLNGLRIENLDGNRCSIRQAAIRTVTRLLEVNPIFLGGLPAAARILWTRKKQRFGDKWAGTLVVPR